MKFTPLYLALITALFLPSCAELGGSYYSTGYSTGGVYEEATYYRPSYSSYSRPYYGSSYAGYYGGRDYCPPNYSDKNHGRETHHDKDDDKEKIRLVRGSDGDHSNRPEGYHTEDWYKHRGYDLHKYTYKDEDGDVKHKAHSSNDKKHH